MIKYKDDKNEYVWSTSWGVGPRFNVSYSPGDVLICLPICCGKKRISKNRLKNYGRKGILRGMRRGTFRIETKPNLFFYALPQDCILLKKEQPLELTISSGF